MKKVANKLIDRLFPDITKPQQEQQTASSNGNPSLEDGLNEMTKQASKSETNLDKDFKLLEASGEKSSRLEKLHNALLSIQPTSTSCEQVFSIAGSIKTKLRSRMKPKTLSILVWLKKYFSKLLLYMKMSARKTAMKIIETIKNLLNISVT